MRMKQKLYYIDNAKRELMSLYRRAKEQHFTAEQLQSQEQEITSSMPEKLPHWARSKVEGYRDALYDLHFQYVKWQHFLLQPDGTLRPVTFDEAWKIYDGVEAVQHLISGLVYPDALDKPYTSLHWANNREPYNKEVTLATA